MEDHRFIRRRGKETHYEFFERMMGSFQKLDQLGIRAIDSIITGRNPMSVYELKGQGGFLLDISEREVLAPEGKERIHTDGVLKYLGASDYLKKVVDGVLEREDARV